MPPIEVGSTRAIGAVGANPAGSKSVGSPSVAPSAQSVTAPAAASAPLKPSVTTSEGLDPGAPPIDIERVTQIRKAVESGSYPLVPARIADAMIAAGLLLRSTKG